MHRRSLLALMLASSALHAESKKKAAAPSVRRKAPPPSQEKFLMLPEPRAMRSTYSIPLGGSRRTVFTPAYGLDQAPGISPYSKEQFAQLGISPETFAERAKLKAEERLSFLTPEFIKDDQGQTRYAVYRGGSPLICTLLLAPSLGKMAVSLFGGEMWAAVPDRHSLYLFPARQAAIQEYTEDLAQRFISDVHAASPELFLIKPGAELEAIAQFTE
jgi:hypothetical protein